VTASPNPGGQNRRLVRTAIANWITAQHIQGLDHVYRSKPPEVSFTDYVTGTAAYRCNAYVFLPSDEETRYVLTGPVLPTGKLIHYRAELEVWHRVYEMSEQDWDDAEDDYDRIIDAVKDCLRAGGRQLGRPDVVFSVGEYRQGIMTEHAPPVILDGGTAQRNGTVIFEVTQTI
jgi:hypothetical protein